MNADVDRMSAELAADLAASNVRRIVDPRGVPWRFHHLLAAGRSLAHALHAFQLHDKSTLSIRLGAGTHALLFGQPVALFEGATRRGKVWDAFEAEHAGKVILNRSEHDKAKAMADAIRGHALASKLLFAPDVVHERTILWEQQGRKRRSTPDARGDVHLVELKSTRCAEPSKFARDALYCGYYAQLADQAAAIESESGTRPWDAYVVAVENTPPYVTQVFHLSQRALEIGERQRQEWFRRLCHAADNNVWTGYAADVVPLDPPEWSESMVAAMEADE